MEEVVLEGIYMNARCRWTLLEEEILVQLQSATRHIPLADLKDATYQEPKGLLTDGVIALEFREQEADEDEEWPVGRGDYIKAVLRVPGVNRDSTFSALRFKKKQVQAADRFYRALKEKL